MNEENSQALLREYAQTGSEAAFRELTSRYVNLVYSAALRLAGGDSHLAQDVTQTVFVHLSKKARQLESVASLGGWLHRDACFTAKNALRRESRRRAREQEAAIMKATEDSSDQLFQQMAPLIDQSIEELPLDDRAAVLMRFFENRDYRDMGRALNGTPDAARMRVNRALAKLRRILSRKGVAVSATALPALLAEKAVAAAPAGLSMKIASAALTGAAAFETGFLSTLLHSNLTSTTMTNIQTAIAGAALVAGIATPVAVHQNAKNKMERMNAAFELQAVEMNDLQSENARISKSLADQSAELSHELMSELLSLRGEVGRLRKDTARLEELEKAKQELETALKEENQAKFLEVQEARRIEDEHKAMGIAKMNDAKRIVLEMLMSANENNGRLPDSMDDLDFASINEAAKQKGGHVVADPGAFEIVYSGRLDALESPMKTIVVREKEAFPTPTGRWAKTYGYADGHSEIHTEPTPDFTAWESERLAVESESVNDIQQ